MATALLSLRVPGNVSSEEPRTIARTELPLAGHIRTDVAVQRAGAGSRGSAEFQALDERGYDTEALQRVQRPYFYALLAQELPNMRIKKGDTYVSALYVRDKEPTVQTVANATAATAPAWRVAPIGAERNQLPVREDVSSVTVAATIDGAGVPDGTRIIAVDTEARMLTLSSPMTEEAVGKYIVGGNNTFNAVKVRHCAAIATDASAHPSDDNFPFAVTSRATLVFVPTDRTSSSTGRNDVTIYGWDVATQKYYIFGVDFQVEIWEEWSIPLLDSAAFHYGGMSCAEPTEMEIVEREAELEVVPTTTTTATEGTTTTATDGTTTTAAGETTTTTTTDGTTTTATEGTTTTAAGETTTTTTDGTTTTTTTDGTTTTTTTDGTTTTTTTDGTTTTADFTELVLTDADVKRAQVVTSVAVRRDTVLENVDNVVRFEQAASDGGISAEGVGYQLQVTTTGTPQQVSAVSGLFIYDRSQLS